METTPSNQITSSKDLTGQTFGELTVIGYSYEDKKWICKCSCGATVLCRKYNLVHGYKKSCGHVNSRLIDLTGQVFGKLTVCEYLGNQKWRCQCSCGNEKITTGYLLRSGQTKTCGKCRADFNDIIGKRFAYLTPIEYIGGDSYKYRCVCTCGKEYTVGRAFLLYQLKDSDKTCPHSIIDCEAMVGKTYGEWKVIEHLGHQRLRCRCSCGTERIILERSLRIGHTRSCGCKKVEHNQETILSRYNEIATNKILEAREPWQIEAIHNKELLTSIIEQFIAENSRKPKIYELSKLLGVNAPNIGKTITKFNLNHLVDYWYTSQVEDKVYEFISELCQENKFSCERHNREILAGAEIDIYIPELKLGIEVNGTYWHSEKYKESSYHQNKTLAALKSGIRLIHLFEYELMKDESLGKIEGYLSSIICKPNTIYARKCDIKKLQVNEYKPFLEFYHLQGSAGCDVAYGLYYNQNLVGVMSFGKPRYNANYEWELIRLCWLPGVVVIGGAEKLLKHFEREYKPKSCITYSDACKFSGMVYKRLGFEYDGITEPNYKWVNTTTGDILARYQTMKHKLVERHLGTEEQTESEIMSSLGYIRIHDSGNYRFIKYYS